MIPEQHKQAIILRGLDFIRVITEAYGPEEGMELWDTIVSTLDPDIKGDIFLAMLTGEYSNTIKITALRHSAGKVAVVKAIRVASGLGLYEAKQVADAVESGKPATITIDPAKRSEAIRELTTAGCLF